jgi:AmiR/NasT family two-component response regulator
MTDHENMDGFTLEAQVDYWRTRALKAEAQNEDLKDLGRAKAKLMGEGKTEQEAHRYIQQRAMDTRRTLGAVAREVLSGQE